MTTTDDEIHRLMAKAVTLLTIAATVDESEQAEMIRAFDPEETQESRTMMAVAELAYYAHLLAVREDCPFQEALSVIGTARAQFMPTEEEQ
jgi:hypothetical protein